MLTPPWTQEQVDALNRQQQDGRFHPYTCGGNRTDARHLDGEGVLVATREGWMCPFCDYRQAWAHGPTPSPSSAAGLDREGTR